MTATVYQITWVIPPDAVRAPSLEVGTLPDIVEAVRVSGCRATLYSLSGEFKGRVAADGNWSLT